MLTDSFRNIFHVEIYALVGFLIFFTFFILISIQAFRMKKDEVDRLSSMPLDEVNPKKEQTGNTTENSIASGS